MTSVIEDRSGLSCQAAHDIYSYLLGKILYPVKWLRTDFPSKDREQVRSEVLLRTDTYLNPSYKSPPHLLVQDRLLGSLPWTEFSPHNILTSCRGKHSSILRRLNSHIPAQDLNAISKKNMADKIALPAMR